MKILLFIHSLRDGGAERVCSYIANYWSDSSFEVTLVTIEREATDEYFQNPNVHRVSLGLAKSSSNPIDAIVSNFRIVNCLRVILIDRNIDVVLSFMTRANIICALSCIRTDKFHIAAERNYPAMDNHGRLWNTLRKLSYRYSDIVVAQTEKGRLWIENHTNAKCVITIPNPVVYPLASNDSVGEAELVPKTPFILAVGRLSPQKQFEHLISAFAALPEKHKHWQLYILGEGQERSRLESLARDMEISERVKLPGRVENMSSWYERAEIFVLSSKYEGFPNALAEAMSHGMPVVSYDCDTGPSDLIDNGVNGFLVKPNDTASLLDRIDELITKEDLRDSFAENAQLVRVKYSLDTIMEKWSELLPEPREIVQST